MRIVSASAVGSPRKNFMKPASSSTLSSGLDAMVGEGEKTTEGCRQTKRAGQEIWDASGETRRSGSKWVAALARPANHIPWSTTPFKRRKWLEQAAKSFKWKEKEFHSLDLRLVNSGCLSILICE